MATYKKYATKNGTPIQVQSAIEDGSGKNIENNYAKQDGYYAQLTAGLAENLNSRMRLSENMPYLFRTTGGALEVGSQCLENEIVGGSIVVNQLVQNGNFATNTLWNWYYNPEGTWQVSNNIAEITVGTTNQGFFYTNATTIEEHKYLFSCSIKASTNALICWKFGHLTTKPSINATIEWQRWSLIVSPPDSNDIFGIYNELPTTLNAGDIVYLRDVIYIDLTQMFGTQIANYIYSLEQANTGAGVAWVKQFLPKDYYDYTATPYFLNVKTTGKKVVGFNAYNNTTGTAKLLGGNQYQITGTYTSVSYADDLGNTETLTIDTNGKFTPTNNGVLTVVGGNATDTCVHLVWDGERDGEFEEYREITYPTSDVELRGIPKLDSDNNLYYDGDKYKSDGTVVRRVAIIRLDELDYEYVEGDPVWQNYFKSTTQLSPLCRNVPAPIHYAEGASNKYIGVTWGRFGGNNRSDKTITNNVSYVYIYDTAYNASTIEQFKNSLQGAYYLYETEDIIDTTETADAFTQRQWEDNWGTEEWIDNRTIPLLVGHNTEYATNLKAKVEVSPESPETDGYYVMKREDGINSYYDLSSYLTDNKYAKLDGELPYNLFKEIHSNVVLVLNITSNNQTVNFNQTAAFQSISWGDGVVNNQITHTYSAKGIYIVSIKGTNILNVYRATFALSNPVPIVKIYIGDAEISIGSESLRGYQGEEIFIPRNITTIKDNAFQNASNLKRIIFESYTPCTIQSAAFDNNNALLYVPLESIDAYKTAWSTYASRIRALVDDKYVADNYAKKEEIATTNLGTITTATIVSSSFYRNNIAVSGGISVGDIVFVQMSNNAVYPTINNNATQLVIFNGSDLSSLTITKAWKVK